MMSNQAESVLGKSCGNLKQELVDKQEMTREAGRERQTEKGTDSHTNRWTDRKESKETDGKRERQRERSPGSNAV